MAHAEVSPGCVAPVALANSGRMGVAARRAVVVGVAILLGCAAVVTLLSQPAVESRPSSLSAKQGWMRKIYRQQRGMSPDQMFMTAIKSGEMAASDATQEVPAISPGRKGAPRLVIQAPAKTQRLQEVAAEPEEPEVVAAAPEGEASAPEGVPPAEVEAEAESQDAAVPEEVAEAAADTQVPEGVVEGQEQIADEPVPEEGAAEEEMGEETEAAPTAEGVPPGYQIVSGAPAESQPPMNVVFQGSPFKVPVQSPGVGLVEDAVTIPPALFAGGGWSEETINGRPAQQKVTVTVKRPAAVEAPEEEMPASEDEAVDKGEEADQDGPGEVEAEAKAQEEASPAAADEASPVKEATPPADEQSETEAMQEHEMVAGSGVGAEEPVGTVQQPYSIGEAVPMIGAARVPEMGQVMSAMGYASVQSYCTLGKRQSPINIEFNIAPSPLPLLLWQVTSAANAQWRTVPVSIESVPSGRSLVLSGASAVMPVGGIAYALQNVHIHAASEHAIASQRFDMEVQFLHSAIVDGVEKFMVVSVFASKADETAPFLAQLAAAARIHDTELTTTEAIVSVDLALVASQVLGQTEFVGPTSTNAQSYYQYDGSFTTAPCTENVVWVVLKNPLAVTVEDLALITQYLGQPSRPVQPLNERIVLSRDVAAAL